MGFATIISGIVAGELWALVFSNMLRASSSLGMTAECELFVLSGGAIITGMAIALIEFGSFLPLSNAVALSKGLLTGFTISFWLPLNIGFLARREIKRRCTYVFAKPLLVLLGACAGYLSSLEVYRLLA